jgi:hypothetical protein
VAVVLQQQWRQAPGRQLQLLAAGQRLQAKAADNYPVLQLVMVAAARCSSEVATQSQQVEARTVTSRKSCWQHCRSGLRSRKQLTSVGDLLIVRLQQVPARVTAVQLCNAWHCWPAAAAAAGACGHHFVLAL